MSERPTSETDRRRESLLASGLPSHDMFEQMTEHANDLERELAEARGNWKRTSMEAEHWLSLASQRQDEIDKLRGQLDAAEKDQH